MGKFNYAIILFQIVPAFVMGNMASSKADHFAFLEDKDSVAYIEKSRLLVYLPGYDDVCEKFKEIYPKAKLFKEQSPTDEENSLVSRVEEWMKGVSNSSVEIAVVNHKKLTTLEKITPFSKLAVSYDFVQLYPYKESGSEPPLIPLFYGWFFNVQDSECKLREQASGLLKEISGKEEFNEEFSKYAIDLPETEKLDIQKYFSTENLFVGKTLLHCTGYFTNYDDTPESASYHQQNAESFGKAFWMEVIGFIVTPRTFGVRLKLSDEDLKLWRDKDKYCSQDEVEWKPSEYSPTNGPGSRAHLTLAVRKDVQAVQTGLDLEAIIKEEVEDQKTHKDRLTIGLTAGELRSYGEGAWAVYLAKSQKFQAMFSNFYLKKE